MDLYKGKYMELVPEVFVYQGHDIFKRQPFPCTVVYINRKHRFFTVEFKFASGSFRESFKFTEERDLACQTKG